MVNSNTTLKSGQDYLLAVSYDAASRATRIYINGEEDVRGTANQVEAYQLFELARDTRNYIGRTQWWDTSYKADNVDFVGTIDDLRVYDVCLTREEIRQLQGIGVDDGVGQLPRTASAIDDTELYDLSGRRTDAVASHLRKGIYVQRGRKFIR